MIDHFHNVGFEEEKSIGSLQELNGVDLRKP